MRLIDADNLKKMIYAEFGNSNLSDAFNGIIDNAPELGYEDGVLSVETATRRAIELEEAYNNGWSDSFSEGENERPKGEWIVKGQDIYCSICNQESAYNEFGASKFSNFCPNCGAGMQEGGAE